jgi:hypothetical protein
MAESGETDFIEADFGIEAQVGLEFVRLKALARDIVEVGTEGVEFIGSEANARSHCVAAVADEQMVALAQSGCEVETCDATPGAAPFDTITANDDGGAIELLEHAGSDDADDADVPGLLAFDDDEVGFGIKPGANGSNSLFSDEAFELLALAVAGVEALSERQSFSEVAGKEKVQRFFGGFEAASGIEAGRELEADFMDAER